MARRARIGLVTMMTASLILAACSSRATSNRPGGSTRGGSIDPAGVLRYGQDLADVFSDNFDPGVGSNDCSYGELSLIYDSLTHAEGEGEVDGGAASGWELNSPTMLTFHLRPGDKFSNGTAVSANAVKQSLMHTTKSPLRTSLAVISSIDTPDARTVVLHLNKPQAGDLLWALTYLDGMIYAPSSIPTAATKPVGSGPFVLARYQAGQVISLKANPLYRDLTKYRLAGIDFIQVDAGPQAVAALKSGQVDMIDLRPEDYPAVKADPGIGISVTPSLDYVTLQLRLNEAPFDNQDVRAALEYAIDRNELNRVVFNGLGEAADQLFPKSTVGHDPSLAFTYSYNPTKAKAMLTAAGMPDGVSFDVVIAEGEPTIERMAPLVQSEMSRAGFKVNIVRVPSGELFTDVYLHHQGNAVVSVNLTSGPALWSNLKSSYTSAGFSANALGSVRPEIASLVAQAESGGTFDSAAVGPSMQAASRLIMSEGLEVPVVFEKAMVAFNKSRVGGPPVAPIGACRSNLEGVFIRK